MDFTKKLCTELKAIAKILKIKYYYKLNKAQLVDALCRVDINIINNITQNINIAPNTNTKKITKEKKSSFKLGNIFPFKAALFTKTRKLRNIPKWLKNRIYEETVPVQEEVQVSSVNNSISEEVNFEELVAEFEASLKKWSNNTEEPIVTIEEPQVSIQNNVEDSISEELNLDGVFEDFEISLKKWYNNEETDCSTGNVNTNQFITENEENFILPSLDFEDLLDFDDIFQDCDPDVSISNYIATLLPELNAEEVAQQLELSNVLELSNITISDKVDDVTVTSEVQVYDFNFDDIINMYPTNNSKLENIILDLESSYDMIQNVKRKRTCPIPVDCYAYAVSPPRKCFPYKIPNIIVTSPTPVSSPGYLNYGTAEIEIDPFLSELMNVPYKNNIHPVAAETVAELLNEMALSDDDNDYDNSVSKQTNFTAELLDEMDLSDDESVNVVIHNSQEEEEEAIDDFLNQIIRRQNMEPENQDNNAENNTNNNTSEDDTSDYETCNDDSSDDDTSDYETCNDDSSEDDTSEDDSNEDNTSEDDTSDDNTSDDDTNSEDDNTNNEENNDEDDTNSEDDDTNNEENNDNDDTNNEENTNNEDNIDPEVCDLFYGGGIGEIFPFDDDIIVPSKNYDHLKYVNIRFYNRVRSFKFNTHMERFKVTIKKNLPKMKNNDLITAALNEIIEYSKNKTNFQKGDKINIIIDNPKFFHNISSGYNADDHINKLKEKLMQILTSDESVNLFDCNFNIYTINMPRGSGHTRILNLATNIKTKKSIIQIKNTDNLCCP